MVKLWRALEMLGETSMWTFCGLPWREPENVRRTAVEVQITIQGVYHPGREARGRFGWKEEPGLEAEAVE